VLGERKRRISGQMSGREVQRERQRAAWLDETEYRLDVARANGAIAVRFLSQGRKVAHAHAAIGLEAGRSGLDWNHRRRCGLRAGDAGGNGFDLASGGVQGRAYVYTEREAAYARLMPAKTAADTGKKLLCPMPGLVVSIVVKEGQEVKAGETLAVVEAMKMEKRVARRA
jgi:propionyl-CoA carboxylase alpha chain